MSDICPACNSPITGDKTYINGGDTRDKPMHPECASKRKEQVRKFEQAPQGTFEKVLPFTKVKRTKDYTAQVPVHTSSNYYIRNCKTIQEARKKLLTIHHPDVEYEETNEGTEFLKSARIRMAK